jgi:hypothetical protein
VTRATALAAVLVLSALPVAAAEAQVVMLRPHPGPKLEQGPQLSGARVAWSQHVCLRGCGDFPPSTEGRVEILSARPQGRRDLLLFRAKRLGSFSGPNVGYSSDFFEISERALALSNVVTTHDDLEGDRSEVRLRAGLLGERRALLVDCSANRNLARPPPIALDGHRIAYDPDPCDDAARVILRDLATGASVSLPEPAGGAHLRLRGRYAAWIEGANASARLVVHDLLAGAAAYSSPAPGVTDLDLDTDGTVAAVTGERDPRRSCPPGRLVRYPAAAPAPEDLGPACAASVRIAGGRIAFLAPEGLTRSLRQWGPDEAMRDLVRFGRALPGGFDFDGTRLVWSERDCGGGQAIFMARRALAPVDPLPLNCRARFGRAAAVAVRHGVASVPLACPRGCGGELRLRHMARRDFSLLRDDEPVVRLRLNRRALERLRRRGSLEAHAVLVTYNRAGERQARRRAITLVAG